MKLENIEALKVRNRNERAERYIALKRHENSVRSTHRTDISISFIAGLTVAVLVMGYHMHVGGF